MNFNQAKSKLPKELLDKGLMMYYDSLFSKDELMRLIKDAERESIKEFYKKILKNFHIGYFDANDVEKCFRKQANNGNKKKAN